MRAIILLVVVIAVVVWVTVRLAVEKPVIPGKVVAAVVGEIDSLRARPTPTTGPQVVFLTNGTPCARVHPTTGLIIDQRRSNDAGTCVYGGELSHRVLGPMETATAAALQAVAAQVLPTATVPPPPLAPALSAPTQPVTGQQAPLPAECGGAVEVHHDPARGVAWELRDPDHWRVIELWTNQPNHSQAMRKLLLRPGENPRILMGGALYAWPAACEAVARQNYERNTYPPVTVADLAAAGLVVSR